LVNENGKVVAAKNKDKTSTDDIELINHVIKQVKEQVTYEPNSEVTSEIIVVYLKENP
jgi:hypothetical protein